jgi:DNA-binding transcriptional LysR family regulator
VEGAISFYIHDPMVIPKTIDWSGRIGRRLRLRDLHVFFTAVQAGSMARAAQALGVSQPAISKVISELEHTLGVRLLDRGARGVETTIYGRALLARGNIAFDELRQSVRDIEFLADPTAGEVRIECQESIAAAILPQVIHRFSQAHPRVVLHVEHLGSLAGEYTALRRRSIDLTMLRIVKPPADKSDRLLGGDLDDLNVELLFHDRLVVVAGRCSPWARRRKIDLAELVDEPWVLSELEAWNYVRIAEAFAAHGLRVPRTMLETRSTHLRANLVGLGPYITTFPKSVFSAYADRFSLKELPIDLPKQPWPVVVITLKNRTLSPVVERFIEQVRDFTGPLRARG